LNFIIAEGPAVAFWKNFHWRRRRQDRRFRGAGQWATIGLRIEAMPDPTALVLTYGFAAAVVVFGVFGGLRLAKRRWREQEDGGELDGFGMLEPGDVWIEPRADRMGGGVGVGVYRPMDLAGVGLVFLVFSGLVLGAASRPATEVAKLNADTLWLNIGFHFLMAAAVASLVVRRIGMSEWLGLRWKSWPSVLWIGPSAVALMWLVFLGLQIAGYVEWMEWLGVPTVQDSVKLLQDEQDLSVLGLMVFAAVVAAPLCEELVFRGYFYPVLKKYSGAWPAAISSSLVFACAHGSLTALLPLFLFGMLLSWIYERTGSLWAPIAAHFCFNGATVAYQLSARIGQAPIDSIP
jgi:membrane protease YdiL (CAAX protease family)